MANRNWGLKFLPCGFDGVHIGLKTEWFKIVELFPVSIAAIGTPAIPGVGVLSSALVLGERVGI